jgi:hypothetical protein
MRSAKRITGAEEKLEKLQNRSGPEKKTGEKIGEYKERIKRHEYVTERQVQLAEFHLARKKRLVWGKESP